jgi:hypothetical protein
MAETPVVHLALGSDEATNRNWKILDAAIHALGLRTIIPDDLLIQGNLEVTGNAMIDGILTTLGGFDPGIQPVTFRDLTADNALFAGGVTFQPGSIAGSALAANASLYSIGIGTPMTSVMTVPVTPTQLATVVMNPIDDQTRFELVVMQATLRFGLSADQSLQTCLATLTLRRGGAAGVDQASRPITISLSRTSYIDVPVTLVRVTQPVMYDEPRWSLVGSASAGLISCQCSFAQVYVIQFR